MMNGRPVGVRRRVQFLVILVILAWATQLLLQQWGYGQEVAGDAGDAGDAEAAPVVVVPQERFVPGVPGSGPGATLELRGEATVIGAEVKLKQVCRWSEADAAAFAPVADLVLARFKGSTPFKAIGIEEIKSTLHDAGVNLAVISFAGSTSCTVSRSDVEFDEGVALQQWIEARQGGADEGAAGAVQSTDPAPAKGEAAEETVVADGETTEAPAPESAAAKVDEVERADDEHNASPFRRLRDMLATDVSQRLNVPSDQLQLSFNVRDERVLNLAEPQFRFQIDAKRVRNLGAVSWEVTIVTDAGSRKVVVAGTARAWQRQVIVNQPLAYKQVIRETDLVERRALVERLLDEPLLERSQAVGQQAARDLKPGTILTAKLVDPVPLAKVGQFITITLARGNVRVKTVGRALEGGAFGQTIRVKNEATRDVYEVVLTGPQEGTMGPAEDKAVAEAEAAKVTITDAKAASPVASVSGD